MHCFCLLTIHETGGHTKPPRLSLARESRRIFFCEEEMFSELLSCSLMSEEAFIAKVFIQMLPMDAVWRERILLALSGCGVA